MQTTLIQNDNRPTPINTNVPINNKWSEFKITGKNIVIRSYSAACCYHSRLYVYGGLQILNGALKDFHFIELAEDIKKFQWKDVKCVGDVTPGPRAKHSMVTYGSNIYLIGGVQNSQKTANEIYCFNIDEGKWRVVNTKGVALPHLDSFGCILSGKKIFLVCGYDSSKCNFLNSVYCFDCESEEIQLLYQNSVDHASPKPRSNCSAAEVDGKIYVFGGKAQDTRLNDFWAFDIERKSWEGVKDEKGYRPIMRSGHTMNSHKGDIYVFGGIHEVTWELDDLHIYSPKTNTWRTVEVDSPRRKLPEITKGNQNAKAMGRQSPMKKQNPMFDTFLNINRGRFGGSSSPKNKIAANMMPNFTREASETQINVSPGKMIGEQKKKAFLHKKHEMLKEFQVGEKDRQKYLTVEPVTQAMKNSLDIIGNANPSGVEASSPTKERNPTHRLTDFGRTTCSRFLQPLSSTINIIQGRRPCARDGHTATIIGSSIVIFGGDRHQMSFNDLFRLNLDIVAKQLGF